MPGTVDPLGDSFGLLAWDSGNTASATRFYKDDDARGILAGLATAALLRTDRWSSTLAAAILANLRQTTRAGFGPPAEAFDDIAKAGWRATFDDPAPPAAADYSPHYQSWIWSTYLWAYAQSGYAPLYERAAAAIGTMMAHYPARWQPTSNGITMQRARMLLPLAWLVRANDTALHRGWLATVADGLLVRQDAATGAIREEVSATGWAAAARVPNNDDYGTFEAPLNQNNSDPVSDLLYTSNFAAVGLHEAAAALGDGDGDGGDGGNGGNGGANATRYRAAADALAGFLVRVQASSGPAERPELDGAFFRAFDFEKWEVWASDADVGWGAWSIETGWTQSWISMVLGLRQLDTSLWELTQGGVDLRDDLAGWVPFFFPPAPPPAPPAPPRPCLNASSLSAFAPGQQPLRATVETDSTALCAPAPGKDVSHVQYSGGLCGGSGGKAIAWASMETLDPRAGVQPGAQCTWEAANESAAWRAMWTGGCGTGPSSISTLPTHVC